VLDLVGHDWTTVDQEGSVGHRVTSLVAAARRPTAEQHRPGSEIRDDGRPTESETPAKNRQTPLGLSYRLV